MNASANGTGAKYSPKLATVAMTAPSMFLGQEILLDIFGGYLVVQLAMPPDITSNQSMINLATYSLTLIIFGL